MQIKNEVSCSIIKALGVFILTSRIILTKSLFTLLQCRPIPIRKLSGLMSRWMKFLVWTNSILLIICGRNKTEKIKSTFLTRTRSTNHTVHRSWPISIFLIFHLSWNRTATFSIYISSSRHDHYVNDLITHTSHGFNLYFFHFPIFVKNTAACMLLILL